MDIIQFKYELLFFPITRLTETKILSNMMKYIDIIARCKIKKSESYLLM